VKQKLLQAFSGLVDSVVAAAPKFVVGILLVIAGFIVAKLIEVVLRYMLTRVRFDRLMEKAGIDKGSSADRPAPAVESVHSAPGLFSRSLCVG
jgi:hypothetical protein